MFYNILDKERLNILPLLKSLKKDFYLAGGTALALYIGHRDSVDFDFFSERSFDTEKLFKRVKNILKDKNIKKIQQEKDTLTILVENKIKISFFSYPYPLLNNLILEEKLNLASLEDIACMKLSAITNRASEKDYVDLYFILQRTTLKNLLNKASEKFSDLDTNLILKSLIYFDDIDEEKIIYKNDNKIDFETIKKGLIKKVKELK